MTMSTNRIEHPEIVDRLSDFLNGDVSSDDHAEIEGHLSACGACRRVLEELRDVVDGAAALGPLDPPRDLWAGIAATIQAPTPVAREDAKVIALPTAVEGSALHDEPREVDIGPTRYTFSTPQLAAASIVLIAASSVATWVAGPGLGGGAPLPAAVAPAGAVTMASDAAAPPAELADELALLEQTLDEARTALDPNTVRVLERNLAVIEQAIQDSRLALEQDPGNEFLAAHLERVYERKVEYLREAARVAEWSD